MRIGIVLLSVVLAAGCAAERPGAERISWFTDHWICDGCAKGVSPAPPPPIPVVPPPPPATKRRGG